MAGTYGKYDERVVDYELYILEPPIIDPVTKAPLELRGPRPSSFEPGHYFVCIGGAQTFGRFCIKPFPLLLQESIDLPALNLGRGGAGPSFFSPTNEVLLAYVRGARFAVLQVMSGRSAGNSLFRSEGLGSYVRRSDGIYVGADEAFANLLRERSRKEVQQIVAETREEWMESFRALLKAIDVPRILLWFSIRPPAYRDGYDSVSTLFRDFPQLVNEKMIRALMPYCDHYVSCVSSRGLPHLLNDRITGEPVVVQDEWGGEWSVNSYYPSPEMHLDAARRLEPVARRCAIGEGKEKSWARRVLGKYSCRR